jgi:hypothetical protein
VLRHYDRPLWRDRLFWIVAVPSGLVTALFVGTVLLLAGVPEDPIGWLRPVLLGIVVLVLSFRLLGAGVTTSRRFRTGLGEGSTARPGDLESKGRAAGAVVGRALRAGRTTAGADAEPARVAAQPAAPPAPTGAATEPADGHHTAPDSDPGPSITIAADAATSPAAAPEPPPVTIATPSTADAVDRAARVAGAMLGRRLAERRRSSRPPDAPGAP